MLLMLLAINYAQNYASIIGKGLNAATGDNSMYCMIPDPFPSLVPRPSYHDVPVRGPGNNGLRMRLIKTVRYA